MARMPPPRLAIEDEVVATETESAANLFELVDEPIELPEVHVVRMLAVARPQLVVVVVLDPGSGEVAVAKPRGTHGSPQDRRGAARA